MNILPNKCILLEQYRVSIFSTHNIAVTYQRVCMSPPSKSPPCMSPPCKFKIVKLNVTWLPYALCGNIMNVFYNHVTVHRDKFPYNKNQLGALISQIYFGNETLHVSDSSSVHHQELLTVHSAMVYVIQVCRQLSSSSSSSSRIRMELQFHPDPAAARKLSTNLYDIYHCWVYIE
jgi:hypothetical protein